MLAALHTPCVLHGILGLRKIHNSITRSRYVIWHVQRARVPWTLTASSELMKQRSNVARQAVVKVTRAIMAGLPWPTTPHRKSGFCPGPRPRQVPGEPGAQGPALRWQGGRAAASPFRARATRILSIKAVNFAALLHCPAQAPVWQSRGLQALTGSGRGAQRVQVLLWRAASYPRPCCAA